MVSVEPWSVPGCGYLNFLATGEVCEGDTIHDRQHPHDLFMELAADYDRWRGECSGWSSDVEVFDATLSRAVDDLRSLYVGVYGETVIPALQAHVTAKS